MRMKMRRKRKKGEGIQLFRLLQALTELFVFLFFYFRFDRFKTNGEEEKAENGDEKTLSTAEPQSKEDDVIEIDC